MNSLHELHSVRATLVHGVQGCTGHCAGHASRQASPSHEDRQAAPAAHSEDCLGVRPRWASLSLAGNAPEAQMVGSAEAASSHLGPGLLGSR